MDQAVADCSYEVFSSGEALESRLKAGNLEGVVLAVVDNQMFPGPTGVEIIRRYARNVQFPFILNYGGDNSIGEQAVADGAVGYFKKPDSWSELAAKAKRILEPSKG